MKECMKNRFFALVVCLFICGFSVVIASDENLQGAGCRSRDDFSSVEKECRSNFIKLEKFSRGKSLADSPRSIVSGSPIKDGFKNVLLHAIENGDCGTTKNILGDLAKNRNLSPEFQEQIFNTCRRVMIKHSENNDSAEGENLTESEFSTESEISIESNNPNLLKAARETCVFMEKYHRDKLENSPTVLGLKKQYKMQLSNPKTSIDELIRLKERIKNLESGQK